MIEEAGPPTAEKRPHFITAARPTAVPPALLKLAPDAVISEERRIGRQNRYCGAFGAGDYREEIEETIARQSEDLFTVNEAAQVLADSKPGKSGTEWVKELRAAHRGGALAIRDSSTRIPYKPTHPSAYAEIPSNWTATENNSGRDFCDLVRGADVDVWLRQATGYGFPEVQRPDQIESAEERQSRRLDRLAALGGSRLLQHGRWSSSGRRGALAALAREEKAAGRTYSDVRDVARDLDTEADRRRLGRTMPSR